MGKKEQKYLKIFKSRKIIFDEGIEDTISFFKSKNDFWEQYKLFRNRKPYETNFEKLYLKKVHKKIKYL